MKRLVLLGNGFDKAHGLPTSYGEFIFYSCKKEILNCLRHCNDGNQKSLLDLKLDVIESGLSNHVENLKFTHHGKNKLVSVINDIKHWDSDAKITNSFAFELITASNGKYWSDIEGYFYRKLIGCLGIKNGRVAITKTSIEISDGIKKLNKEFEKVKLALEYYLFEYVEEQYKFEPQPEFINIFKGNKDTDSILLLNFNYTKTAEMYLPSLEEYNPQLINIHGKLNDDEKNPMIFGFGDEYDKLYKVIEEYNDNSLFKHIKSFGYVKSNNYRKMESFVETEPYEIFIIGHSCGLSDRTLLKYLFEHDYCTSIKIFYYEEEKGNFKKSRENHNFTAQEISRHFEDKAKMRSRIVSFEDSEPCPQVKLEKIG